MKKENNGRNSTEKKDDGAIRLLVPIKSFEHGATVQDILFANKDLPFESITFLHVINCSDLSIKILIFFILDVTRIWWTFRP